MIDGGGGGGGRSNYYNFSNQPSNNKETYSHVRKKPNLFTHARKELSQDAFIAWFIEWADPKYRNTNSQLPVAAESFLKKLISLQSKKMPDQIHSVEVHKQWHKVDVMVKVNDSHIIIIEDKVDTVEHSNQLEHYREMAEKEFKESGRELVCVYLKRDRTCSKNLDINEAKNKGFEFFGRSDFLEVLNEHDVQNDIYGDFRDRLKELDTLEGKFKTEKIGCWSWHAWKGFYQEIEEQNEKQKLGLVNWWKRVNHHTGVLGLAMGGRGLKPEISISLLIEQEHGNLCFKVEAPNQKVPKDVSEHYHKWLMSEAEAKPDLKLKRPKPFRSGVATTIAVVPRQHWLGEDDKKMVDIKPVLERLCEYNSWLGEIIKKAPDFNESV